MYQWIFVLFFIKYKKIEDMSLELLLNAAEFIEQQEKKTFQGKKEFCQRS